MDTEIKKSLEKLERKMSQGFKIVNQEFKNVRQEMKDGFKNMTGLIVFEVSHLKRQMDDRFAETDERFDILYKHVDGFTNLHKTLDMELAATRLQQGRLEERVSILETKG